MPSRLNVSLLACGLLAGGVLQAQSSEYPLAINLPTVDRMQFWDLGVAFTHRFAAPVKDHGKDAYGLDGLAYAGVGVAIGFKPVKGLNILLYRTADNKTFTLGFQQQVMDTEFFRMAFRAERYDEVVDRYAPPAGATLNNATAYERGVIGGSFQVPMEIFFPGDRVMLTLVPTYLTRTTTSNFKFSSDGATPPVYQPGLTPAKKGSGVFNLGVGVRVNFTEAFGWVTEFYPKPSRLPSDTFRAGFATGITYKTFKHRFTLTASNVHGTTANQVLGGDYDHYRTTDGKDGAGPWPSSQWSLGFNVSRVF
ncbi:MAG: hypothetical protein HYZ13_09660 [Acidobacteria bacterium]|nr:hypothetical protein [Acidobacteriota bacterium]